MNLNSYLKKPPTLLSPFGNCLFTIHVIILLQVLENKVHIFFLVLIGLLYPCLDRHLSISNPDSHKGEWSKVMRCIAVFVGINHASAKLDFVNNMQLSMTLAAMSIGLWWLFDRSPCGFGLGVGIAVLATLVTQLLVYNGVYNYSKAEFLFVRSWLPCIFFSGGVTMGNIGRQLALYDESPASPTKPKTD